MPLAAGQELLQGSLQRAPSYSYSRAPTSQVFPVLTYCLHSATQGTRALRPGMNRNLTCVFLRAIKNAHNSKHYLSHVIPISNAFKIQGWHITARTHFCVGVLLFQISHHTFLSPSIGKSKLNRMDMK